MQRDLLPQIAIGVLVIGAIAFGLIVTGGPSGGRMQKRDKERMKDLRELVEFVHCISDEKGNKLPETLEPNRKCHRNIQLNDPFTDKPYSYTRLSDKKFSICAEFEWPEILPERHIQAGRFERSQGCAVSTYNPN